MRSVSAKLKPSTRPTSLIACFPLSVPKATICATRSSPYFCFTYAINSSRRSKQKSTSMSGIDFLSGFRKRSNSKPYGIGSRSVISSA
jgi:hypothetical protein